MLQVRWTSLWHVVLVQMSTHVWVFRLNTLFVSHVFPGARNHHYFILFLLSLVLMGAWMFYGCLTCERLCVRRDGGFWPPRCHRRRLTVPCVPCAVSSDWTARCSLRYEEQGVWGVVSALVSCSPWLLAVFLLAVYHTCWSGLMLVMQLYQVTEELDAALFNVVREICSFWKLF